jgi:hypothetical protein
MLGQSIGRSQKMLKEIVKDQIEPLFQKNSKTKSRFAPAGFGFYFLSLKVLCLCW